VLGMTVLARVFARLAREFPSADGPYAYIEATSGRLAAFISIWCYWVSCWITNAAIAIGVVGYLTKVVPALADVSPALLSLAVLDGVATIAGTRFGRTRIYNGKSAEGTGTGIFITFLVLLLFISIHGALIVAVIAGIIELISPIDDNLVIPVSICLILTVIPALI